MSHYAKIVNNLVVDVIVAEEEFFDTFLDGTPGTWLKTSYNTRGGVHYAPDSEVPDGGAPLRMNFAGIGDSYNPDSDAFSSPQPYNSWVLNTATYLWEPPLAYPTDGAEYDWNETTVSWDAL